MGLFARASEVAAWGATSRRLDDTVGVYFEVIKSLAKERDRNEKEYVRIRKEVVKVIDPMEDQQVSEFGDNSGGANPVGSEPSHALFDHGNDWMIKDLKGIIGAALELSEAEAEEAGLTTGAMWRDLGVKGQDEAKIEEILAEGLAEGRIVKVTVKWKTVRSERAKKTLLGTGMNEAEAESKCRKAILDIQYQPHGLSPGGVLELRL